MQIPLKLKDFDKFEEEEKIAEKVEIQKKA
jgi:hypothetical protein